MIEFPIFSELPIRIISSFGSRFSLHKKQETSPLGIFESIEPRKSVWGLLVENCWWAKDCSDPPPYPGKPWTWLPQILGTPYPEAGATFRATAAGNFDQIWQFHPFLPPDPSFSSFNPDFLESTLVITIKGDASKLKEGLWDCVSCVKSGNTLFPSAPRAFDSPPPNIEHRERCSLPRFVRLHIRHQQWQHHCEFLPE